MNREKQLEAILNNSGGANTLSLFSRRDSLKEIISKTSTPDPELSRQLSSVESQIKLQSGTTVNRPRAQQELADIQSKMGDAGARRDAASASISQLNKLINVSKGGSVSPKSQVEIEAINRQLELENNGLKNLKEKLNQAQGLIKDDPTANFRQTLVGEPDHNRFQKKKTLTTGLAGMSALVILSLIFMMIEIFDGAIKTPSQFGKLIKLNLKGVLNNVPLKKHQLDSLILNDFEGPK